MTMLSQSNLLTVNSDNLSTKLIVISYTVYVANLRKISRTTEITYEHIDLENY